MQTRVVEIAGFGPVTVRALSEKEWLDIQREGGEDYALRIGLVIQRGVVQPDFTELGRLEGRDEEIDAIANAIIDLTRANIL